MTSSEKFWLAYNLLFIVLLFVGFLFLYFENILGLWMIIGSVIMVWSVPRNHDDPN